MQALRNREQKRSYASDTPLDSEKFRELTAGLILGASEFIAGSRIEETVRGWLARADHSSADPDRAMTLFADALAMATSLTLFTPSSSGSTAFDRLARKQSGMDRDEATVLQWLRRAEFRLLRVEVPASSDGVARLRDLASNEVLDIADEQIGPEVCGMPLAGWLIGAGAGRYLFAAGVTPLDEAGLAVASGFIRPGRSGLVNPLRCAEAVFRHVVRHGTPEIPGLNRPLPGEDDLAEEMGELDVLAMRWAEPGSGRDPEDVQFVRMNADVDSILAMLASAANTREHGLGVLSDGYAAIAFIQLETVHRRSSAGSGSVRIETVAAALNAAIAGGDLPGSSRTVFEGLRQRLGKAAGDGSKDAELDRLIGRIQALRAKTVEQGCTEQEALAAAAKVAELLDRYGLSLSELDMSRQACEGSAVETQRRRTAPIDDCVPSVAGFFDCRVWGEKSASGLLRYVFFGLPADVVAARYLYDLVEQAFETETARFRAGATYVAMPSGMRRTASNSFQIGLSRGIAAKLQTLREARETTLRRASGRDLVVVKADLVEAELAALGLKLRARSRSGGRRILRDVFEEGHETGLGFEYTAGVGHDSQGIS